MSNFNSCLAIGLSLPLQDKKRIYRSHVYQKIKAVFVCSAAALRCRQNPNIFGDNILSTKNP